MNIFDFINDISYSKTDLRNSETFNKDFSPFLMNRGMAQYIDTVLLASEMNRLYNLDNSMIYSFYLNSVSKKKRYSKWPKQEPIVNKINIIQQYYQISLEKAIEFVKILTEEQINLIENYLNIKGDVVVKRS